MTYTVPPGRYSDVNSAFVQAYIDAAIAGVVELAPETLNSLNELAAAINDDPAFYATIASQVSELNTDVTALNTALGIAENDSDVGTFSSPTLPDGTTLRAVLEAFASAYDTTKSNLEGADTALSGRIDTLEADPTTATAVSQVQADVDQNELDSDSADTALSNRLDTLEADPTTQTIVDNLETALDGRLDILEVDPTTQTLLDAEETARENADTALSGRLDTLEVDPTTQTLLDAESTTRGNADTALSGRLDVLEADPTTATAVAAVQTDVDANEADRKTYFDWDSNLSKVINPLRGSRIDVGNNITFYPAAGYNTEIKGNLTTDNTTKVFFTLTDAADDAAAATAGVDVGQLYRNGSVVMIRVS